tara:strand:- start:752 stop:1075 length:324 start_codon:yes stop_codon:yes gene_type:complete
MKNIEEKENKLKETLNRLHSISTNMSKMEEDISGLDDQKNQLLGEKNSAQEKYQKLLYEHHHLKKQLEKSQSEINNKFDKKNEFSKKVDELNQETENLLEEIDEWQT